MIQRFLDAAKKKGVAAEVLELTRDVTPVVFEDNQLQSMSSQRTADYGLRVIADGRIGFAASSDADKPEELVARAMAASKNGMPAEFDFPKPGNLATLCTDDDDLADLDSKILIDEGLHQHAVVRRSLGDDPAIMATLTKSLNTIRIANSSGADYSQNLSACEQRLLLAFPGSGWGPYAEQTALGFKPLDDKKLDWLIKQYQWSAALSKPASGKRQVLFTPGVLYALLWRITTAISGESLRDGVSVLEGGVDQQVLPEMLTIWDSPHYPDHPPARLFDDEGVATQARKIFDKGVFTGFIHNLASAAHAKVTPTGHGYKAGRFESGMRVPPSPQPAHLTIEPGDTPHETLIKGMKDGVILTSVLGAHSGNIPAGELSVSVGVGYHVKDGHIMGRAIDTMISGNVWEMFEHLAAISSDTSDGGLPFLLFDGLNVTSA